MPAEIVTPSGLVTLLLFVKILIVEDPELAKLTRPPALFVRERSAEETASAVDGECAAVEDADNYSPT